MVPVFDLRRWRYARWVLCLRSSQLAGAACFPRVQTVAVSGPRITRNSPRFPFWAPVASLLAFGQPQASRLSGWVPPAYERLVGGSVRDHTGSWGFGRAGPHTNGGCGHTRRVCAAGSFGGADLAARLHGCRWYPLGVRSVFQHDLTGFQPITDWGQRIKPPRRRIERQRIWETPCSACRNRDSSSGFDPGSGWSTRCCRLRCLTHQIPLEIDDERGANHRRRLLTVSGFSASLSEPLRQPKIRVDWADRRSCFCIFRGLPFTLGVAVAKGAWTVSSANIHTVSVVKVSKSGNGISLFVQHVSASAAGNDGTCSEGFSGKPKKADDPGSPPCRGGAGGQGIGKLRRP